MKKNYFQLSWVVVFIFCFSTILNAQDRKQDNNKNKPFNSSKKQAIQNSLEKVVNSYDQQKLKKLTNEMKQRNSSRKQEALLYAQANGIPLRLTNNDGSFAELQYISDNNTPVYYSTYNVDAAVSTRTNYLNTGGGLGLDLNGNGMTAYVWDGGATRLTHQEFDGAGGNNRVSIGDGQTTLNGNSFHAQHVTGTIVASGFEAAAKGMAWQANAITNDWNNDTSEATPEAANGMLLSNHSYGYRVRDGNGNVLLQPWQFGAYDSNSRDWDEIMYNAPYYLMVVAAGNDGNDNSANSSPLDGQSNYDKLTGHSVSKNNIVIANGQDANINGDGTLNSVTRNASSSEGPTDDYRIKPDIMGNGTGLYSAYDNSDSAYNSITGTSMASPNVCGSLLLLQEHYNDLNGSFMRAASLKGLLLHTADDTAANGPDANTGWGLMNSKVAAETITADNTNGYALIRELSLNDGETYQITIESDATNPLLASISWTDPAGTVQDNDLNNNAARLVNDLDLRIDNGTTYEPWRLTGVTTNGTGDNIKDPYERVDINGASGFYTLTVTHKGSLSGGSQDFTLILTGAREGAATPVVSFSSTSDNTIEGTDCSFTDITVPVTIGQAPSANADVNFTVSGGTASDGVDYQLLTNSVTFNAGSTTAQNMILRVFSDGFIEGDETVIIDFTVNPNGGDASANTNADTLTVTINDDDFGPVTSQTVTVLTEDFEDATGWTTIDQDGDNQDWVLDTNAVHNFVGQHARSYSWSGFPYTPNNYLMSPQFTIPANATSVNFSYEIGGSTDATYYQEHYSVYFTTDISSEATITSGVVLEDDRTIPAPASETRSHDLSALAGQTGYVVFRHHNVTDEWYLGLDTILIEAQISSDIQTDVNFGATDDQISLNGSGTVYTSDSATDKLMLSITNNDTFDFGCVEIAVTRSGTGGSPYNGSTAPDLTVDKTFYINPTNAVVNGDATITFYFTEAEIAGWEAATGNTYTRNDLRGFRDDSGPITFAPDNTINATETTNLTVGAFGSHVTLTGNFTGISGGFLFAPDQLLSNDDAQISQGIILYPNPTTSQLHIKLPNNQLPEAYTIYNTLGQEIRHVAINNTSDLLLDVTDLTSGLYFITITDDTLTNTLQFIKE